MRASHLCLLVVLAMGLSACGGGSDSGDNNATTPSKAPAERGKVSFTYAEPANEGEVQAKEVLTLGGVEGIARGFAKSFRLKKDVKIRMVNGSVGPYYDPSDRSITLSYGFASYVGHLLINNFPALEANQRELGKQWAAINDFIYIHEWAHALIDQFDIPVVGREEDAADGLATVFLTKFVDHGAEYAFDAARFFDTLSARQRKLAEDDYWDEHSLDKQRAYTIVCHIAGAAESDYEIIQQAGILGEDRLRRCPAEYEQLADSWQTLLKPYLGG